MWVSIISRSVHSFSRQAHTFRTNNCPLKSSVSCTCQPSASHFKNCLALSWNKCLKNRSWLCKKEPLCSQAHIETSVSRFPHQHTDTTFLDCTPRLTPSTSDTHIYSLSTNNFPLQPFTHAVLLSASLPRPCYNPRPRPQVQLKLKKRPQVLRSKDRDRSKCDFSRIPLLLLPVCLSLNINDFSCFYFYWSYMAYKVQRNSLIY